MKNSGIEWVGEIPKSWNAKKAKFNFENTKHVPGIKSTEYERLALTMKGVVHRSKEDTDGLQPKDFLTYQLLRKSELVFKLIDLQNVTTSRVGLAHDTGLVSPAYIILRATGEVLPDFAEKYFLMLWYREIFNALGDNGVRSNLNATDLLNVPICYPDIVEQKAIVEFLNHKCAEIDALSVDIQSEIETLEAYKRSVITEAVTKGLYKNVPMKDSGIEWIGEIPQNWTVTRLKYLFSSSKGLNITKENLMDEGLPVISYGQIHAKSNDGVSLDDTLLRYVDLKYQIYYPQCEVKQYDFVFADTSEDYDGCGNCVYKRDDNMVFGGYHTIILHTMTNQDNRYLAYLFQTDKWRKQIREKVSGVKVFSITRRTIMNASVILPSFKEQQIIANYLDTVNTTVNKIISDKRKQLTILADYKKSLIYEYVTGKKEVSAI